MMKETLTAGLPGLKLELPEDRIDTLVAFGRAMLQALNLLYTLEELKIIVENLK